METGKQLAERFREVMLDGTWIANTNYTKALSDLNMEDACKKVGNLNSIAALSFHINYYISGVVNVFEGGNLEIRDRHSFDMPSITSESDWNNLRSELKLNSEKFAAFVEGLGETDLETDFVDPKYGSFRRNIEGIIEHSYYHLGQISMLRKLVLEPDNR